MSEPHRKQMPAAGWGRWAVFGGLAVVVVVADQLTKAWVDASFPQAWIHAPIGGLAPPTPVIDGFVRIAKTYNDGGIFGLFGSAAPILAVASLAIVGGIVFYQWRTGAQAPTALTVALGLLLGGAVGNLADRIRLGHVIDFVDMGIGDWRWYTFNVADAAISTSIALLLLLSIAGDRLARLPGFATPSAAAARPGR